MSIADAAKNLRALDGITLRAGWTDPAVATIVAINEEGDRAGRGRPPPRPVLLPVLDENGEEIAARFGDAVSSASRAPLGLAVAVATGDLLALGERIEDMIRARIDVMTPANAPSTIRKKGADAPLRGGPKPTARDRIWTGITHEVVPPA